jgi:hypothetical protein
VGGRVGDSEKILSIGGYMGLIDSVFNTVVNVAVKLPVALAVDVVESPFKIMDGDVPGTTTAKQLKRIKEDLED